MFFTRYFLVFLFLIVPIHSIEQRRYVLSKKKSAIVNTKLTTRKYSQQDQIIIKHILSRREDDYYGILSLSKYPTVAQIEEAYRRLIFRVYTGKRNTPEANAATRRIVRARTELLKRFVRTSSSIVC